MSTALSALYAQVLFDLDPKLSVELSILDQAFDNKTYLFFNTELIPSLEKQKVLDQLPLKEDLKNFLKELSARGRFSLFQEIKKSYEGLAAEKQSLLKGVVYTAHPISTNNQKKLEQKLAQFLNKKTVLLEFKEQKGLLSGLRIEIDGRVFDDSLFYHLKEFKTKARAYGT